MSDRAVRRVRRAVLEWNRRLVAGLPIDEAHDRIAQIESDLWEQEAAAARAGRRGLPLAAAVLRRSLRGVPADLTWSLRARIDAIAFVRRERDGRRRRASSARREWVHLDGQRPFDQTNGLIAFGSDVADDREADEARSLLEKGVIANMINVGFGGGL